MRYLITGGAGFIGQHLTRALLGDGHHVRILDNFSPQIHGNIQSLPNDLFSKVEMFIGDIRDRELLIQALAGVQGVIHLAAETGTGQSMYELERYFSVNVQGTAVLLDVLQDSEFSTNLKSIVVASSRAIYGEGAYNCSIHGEVFPEQRSRAILEKGIFDPVCSFCLQAVKLKPTHEDSPFKPMSFYGLSKQVQEQAVLMFARTKGINAFALRYQNVYGPGQSLNNPYTGILAVFSTLARKGKRIEVYEDGSESRDFVFISDVVNATVKALNYRDNFIGSINVGSGEAVNVLDVANEINDFFGEKSTVEITGAFRMGDIRHNRADLRRAKDILDFEPQVKFSEGIRLFLEWAANQDANGIKSYEDSVQELSSRGLMGHKA